MFTAAIFKIIKIVKTTSINWRMDIQMWYIHNRMYFIQKKKQMSMTT